MEAFKKARIEPNIIFGAADADVSKTYVEFGIGIAILTSISFDKCHDRGLRARDANHLFEPSTTYVRLRSHAYLRKFVLDFIRMLAPHLSEEDIRSLLNRDVSKAARR